MQRAWVRRELQVQRERRELRDGQEPAEAWSASCAEQREPPDGQELRGLREPPEQRDGVPWGAQEHQEQRDAEEREQQELRVPSDGEAWELQALREPPGAEAQEQWELRVLPDGERWEEPGAEESEEEEEYS